MKSQRRSIEENRGLDEIYLFIYFGNEDEIHFD